MTTLLQPSGTTGTDVVEWTGGETGLEDFDTRDLTMPRLSIDHADGVFKNSQTEETFDNLTVILLGLHKSRIMWGDLSDGPDGDPPLCKSPDTVHGFPNIDTELPASKQFPWEAQNVFQPSDLETIPLDDGRQTMPSVGCKTCHFKEWNTDPSGKRPWCSEEWTFPLLYQDPLDSESWVPALFTIRRSGIKPARAYTTPFAAKKTPIFTVATELGLDVNKRGMVKYCSPTFKKIAKTDPAAWPDYFDNLKSAKLFLAQFPMPRTGDEPVVSEEDQVSDGIEGNTIDGEVEPQAPTPPPAPAAPKPPRAAPEPEPEERVISTVGKVRPAAPAAGTVQIDDDEEPPF